MDIQDFFQFLYSLEGKAMQEWYITKTETGVGIHVNWLASPLSLAQNEIKTSTTEKSWSKVNPRSVQRLAQEEADAWKKLANTKILLVM